MVRQIHARALEQFATVRELGILKPGSLLTSDSVELFAYLTEGDDFFAVDNKVKELLLNGDMSKQLFDMEVEIVDVDD